MNKCILHGRLTADPELKTTTSGISTTRFTIAVDRPYSKDKEKVADFINCTAWRGTAEFVSKYFCKGGEIVLEGALHNNNYTDKDGVKHYGMDVQVDNVEFAGSKASNANQGATSAPSNAAAAPSSTASPMVDSIGDLDGFEDILSDDVPF